MLAGIRWQVSNGRNIYFWTGKWVPNYSRFFVCDAKSPFNNNYFVSDFIIAGGILLNRGIMCLMRPY